MKAGKRYHFMGLEWKECFSEISLFVHVNFIHWILHFMCISGIYETPAGTILHQAHKDIELFTLDRVSLVRLSIWDRVSVLRCLYSLSEI